MFESVLLFWTESNKKTYLSSEFYHWRTQLPVIVTLDFALVGLMAAIFLSAATDNAHCSPKCNDANDDTNNGNRNHQFNQCISRFPFAKHPFNTDKICASFNVSFNFHMFIMGICLLIVNLFLENKWLRQLPD